MSVKLNLKIYLDLPKYLCFLFAYNLLILQLRAIALEYASQVLLFFKIIFKFLESNELKLPKLIHFESKNVTILCKEYSNLKKIFFSVCSIRCNYKI